MPCPKPLVATLLAALALAAACPAHAQWVWRDKGGRVNASDLPPPRDIADKDILQRPAAARLPAASASAPALQASAPPKPAVDKDLEAKRRAAEQEQQAKQKAEAERLAQQKADNCKRARNAVTSLESGQRVVRTNDAGEREFLDDAARAEELRRARSVVGTDCR